MFAPRRVPPCFTASVALLKTRRNDTGPDAERLRELLAKPIEDDAVLAEALTLLRASAGMAKAKDTVAQYAAKAREEMAGLPDSPGRQALTTLVDYTIHRHG